MNKIYIIHFPEAVNCGQPDDPDDNGRVDVGTTTFGSTATYSCNAGYILTGSETVECQADRSWSDTAPACIRKWTTAIIGQNYTII